MPQDVNNSGFRFPEQAGGQVTDPAQPQFTPRGGTPAYFIPGSQLTPLQIRPINNMRDYGTVQKEVYKQLIPTSVNLRNYGLNQLLQQQQLPMEQLFAAQGKDTAAESRAGVMDTIRTGAATRGISSSGMVGEANLSADMSYLQGVGAAQMQAREAEDQRQNQLLQQLLSVPENDIRFYQSARQGSIAAGGLFGPSNYGWDQAAMGIAQLVKTIASAAAGGMAAGASGGGGMTMGAGGYMGGGDMGASGAGASAAGAGGWANTAVSYMNAYQPYQNMMQSAGPSGRGPTGYSTYPYR